MKILLLGEKGYLGSYIHEHLNVDVLGAREIFYNGINYDYVINCIGKPDLEYCETNKEETDYSNRDIIKDIIKYYPTSKIINFSSYYVYDDFHICTELSNVTYKYNYTRQKLEGEQLIKNGVSFRVGKLFGHSQVHKQNKLTEYIIKNDFLSLDEISFNPTSLDQIIRVLEYELKNNIFFGVYNLANNNITTHYEYGVFISKILDINKNITKLPKQNRIFHNYGKFTMDCNKIKKHINLHSWEDDMVKYLESL